MDLKGSCILISLTLEIASLILVCQFSSCYHRKTVNHEHHTHLYLLQNWCWVGHSIPCPWEAHLEHSRQGFCKAHCCMKSKCLSTSASLQLGKAGSGAEGAKLQCESSESTQNSPSLLLFSLQTLLFTAFLRSYDFFFKGDLCSPSFSPSLAQELLFSSHAVKSPNMARWFKHQYHVTKVKS